MAAGEAVGAQEAPRSPQVALDGLDRIGVVESDVGVLEEGLEGRTPGAGKDVVEGGYYALHVLCDGSVGEHGRKRNTKMRFADLSVATTGQGFDTQTQGAVLLSGLTVPSGQRRL